MDATQALRDAMNQGTFVELSRRPRHAETLQGFIVGIGRKWAVIQGTREGGHHDGFSAFRLRDVSKVTSDESFFGVSFARTLPTWPPSAPRRLDLDSTRGVVGSLAGEGMLIAIEQERRLSATWVGLLDDLGRKRTWLLEVRPDATWHEEPLGYRNKRITLVSVDTQYLRALATVAGTPPVNE